jgi:hypothetical protein
MSKGSVIVTIVFGNPTDADRDVSIHFVHSCTILTDICMKEDREKRNPAIVTRVYISAVSLTVVYIDSEHPGIQNQSDRYVTFQWPCDKC